MTEPSAVLAIEDLVVRSGDLVALNSVGLSIGAGGRLGIVGESGAGKSMLALAAMGLLPQGWTAAGSIVHDGVQLLGLAERQLNSRRGRTLSMIFQDPTSSLSPTQRVGRQIERVIMRHTDVDRTGARARAVKLLASMKLPRPEELLRAYPHQLSGGQCQRVMIAMALSCYPKLIIADEPTTALDVTVQKEVLRVLDAAVRERQCALAMISHDLAVIAAMCDDVAVMYGGRVVEVGPVRQVFTTPRHPYTAALLKAHPTIENVRPGVPERLPTIPGAVPSLADLPSGCVFRNRCSFATSDCERVPPLRGASHRVACWHPVRESAVCGGPHA